MVKGRNSLEPLRMSQQEIFLPKADTCISHDRALTRVLKTGV